MFKTCLPLSHILEKNPTLRRELISGADVLELRRPEMPSGLPDKPLVFHWGRGIVESGFLRALKRERLAEFLEAYGIQLFSFDLGPSCRRSQFVLPLSRTLNPSQIKDTAARTLDQVRKTYSGRLAVENYNYYPTGLYEHVCRPDFISEFLEELDLGFVLDLGHAAISAVNLKIDLHD